MSKGHLTKAGELTSEAGDALPGDRWTYVGGVVALGIALGVNFLAGNVFNSAEARDLVDALSGSARRFSASIATSSATILALMLTLVGMTRSANQDFGAGLYRRILRLGGLSTVALCGAILLLLLLSLPIGEFENLPAQWYTGLYWVLVSLISGLTGLIITIVLMLFNAIRRVVKTLAEV